VKVRVYEVAKELGVESRVVLDVLIDLGVGARSASSVIPADSLAALRSKIAEGVPTTGLPPLARTTEQPRGPLRASSTTGAGTRIYGSREVVHRDPPDEVRAARAADLASPMQWVVRLDDASRGELYWSGHGYTPHWSNAARYTSRFDAYEAMEGVRLGPRMDWRLQEVPPPVPAPVPARPANTPMKPPAALVLVQAWTGRHHAMTDGGVLAPVPSDGFVHAILADETAPTRSLCGTTVYVCVERPWPPRSGVPCPDCTLAAGR